MSQARMPAPLSRACVLVVAALAGCAGAADTPRASPPPPSYAPLASPQPASPPLSFVPETRSPALPAPLRADSPEQSIAVPGYGDAAVILPLGAAGKRPVVIGLHGHRSRHDWQCRSVHAVFGDGAFGLCPQGIAAPSAPGDQEERFTFRDAESTLREVDAAIAALARALPDYVDAASPVLFGHSSGAYVAQALAERDGARWSRVVLHEGGGAWNAVAARRFASAGGARVLFACGTPACRASAEASVRALGDARVGAKLAFDADSGHRGYGAILDAMRAERAWLVEGDPRW